MLEAVENIPRKYHIHHLTDIELDGYSLGRGGFQKKAHKLNIHLKFTLIVFTIVYL